MARISLGLGSQRILAQCLEHMLYGVQGSLRDIITSIMENQMENKMENEMENEMDTAIYRVI